MRGWNALQCFTSLLVLFSLTSNIKAAQILGLFIHPGKSHFDFFRPLLTGLSKAGHNVTVLSYFPQKEPIANYTDYQLSGMPVFQDIVDLQDIGRDVLPIPFKVFTFFMIHNWGMQSCEVALKSEALKTILNMNQKFDIILTEQFNTDCTLAIAHLLQVPVVTISSCALMPWHYRRMGTPFLYAHMPMNFLPHNEKMSLVERINNFIHYQAINFLYEQFTQRQTNALLHKYFGQALPPIEDMTKSTKLLLINQHYSLNGAIPMTPNVVEVGGLQIQEQKPLDPDLQELMDTHPKGVIYMSWGSMVRPETLPDKMRNALFDVALQFPDFLFLFKWPNVTLPNKPKNVITRSWMPQRDLLCHPHVRGFINHGGLLGTSEAVYCGVPMIVTPFYGDQFLNSAAIHRRKIGVIVKYEDLTAENLVAALETILKPSFMVAVRRVSEAYRNRPIKPLDLSIWWVEHVIDSGGAPLAQNIAIDMSGLVYHSLDIYLFLAITFVLLLLFVKMVIKMILRMLRKPLKVKTK